MAGRSAVVLFLLAFLVCSHASAEEATPLEKAIESLDVDAVSRILDQLAPPKLMGRDDYSHTTITVTPLDQNKESQIPFQYQRSYNRSLLEQVAMRPMPGLFDGGSKGDLDAKAAQIVAVLLAHGYQLSAEDSDVLYLPCAEGFTKLAMALIEAGVDPTKPFEEIPHNSAYSSTPMSVAVSENQSEIETILEAHGVPQLSHQQRIQLQFVKAAGEGDVKAVRSLLGQGAHVNLPSLEGMTALQSAIEPRNYETFRFLVTNGAKPNVESPGSEYRYPLIKAVWYVGIVTEAGNEKLSDYASKMALELIATGAWVSVVDTWGNTPLHYAAQSSLYAIAKSLILHGAKVSPANGEGKTPLDLAVDGQVIKLLKANGAQESPPLGEAEKRQ